MFFYMFIFFFFIFISMWSGYYFILKNSLILESMSFSFSSNFYSSSFFFTLLTVFLFVLIFSFFYQDVSFDFIRFILITFLFVISMVCLIFHFNCFTLILGWDGLGITSYFLVAYYNNWSSINGSLVTMLMNRFGDFFLFWVLSFLIFSNLIVLVKSFFIFFILMVGAFTKSAQIPFSSWLPLAMSAPTPISALVHSSTLVTAGIYVLLKYFYMFNQNNSMMFLFMFGLVTMTTASILGTFEVDGKKIVALSTLSQLGLMVLSLGINMPWASFFHLLGHSFFKSCMFIQVGVFIHMNFGGQDLRGMKENLLIKKFSSSSILICLISLMGFIFMTGFISKEFILTMTSQLNLPIMFFIFIFSVLLTVLYSIRLASSLLSLVKNLSYKLKKINSSFNASSFLIFLSCSFSLFFYKNSIYIPLEFTFFEKLFIFLFLISFFLFYKMAKSFKNLVSLNSMVFQDIFYKNLTKINTKKYLGLDFNNNLLKMNLLNFILNFFIFLKNIKYFYLIFPLIFILLVFVV